MGIICSNVVFLSIVQNLVVTMHTYIQLRMPGVPAVISTPCQTPVWWSTCVQVGLPPATETCRATATTASSRDSLPQFEEGSEPRRGNQSWSTSSTCQSWPPMQSKTCACAFIILFLWAYICRSWKQKCPRLD